MTHLILFSSKDCCLCDDAMLLLREQQQRFQFDVEKKDIYTDKALLIKYKFTIPVLKHSDSEKEIGWPFNAEELADWLSELVEH